MKKLFLSALIMMSFVNLTGCVNFIAQAPYMKEQREKAVANCDKFPKVVGHRFTYCPNTHYAIAKKGIGQYTVIKPTGEMTAYYDNIKFANHYKEQYHFIIERGKQMGVMNLDGKIILPLNHYKGISYEYPKGFALCGRAGNVSEKDDKKVCYDENGNRATQYEKL